MERRASGADGGRWVARLSLIWSGALAAVMAWSAQAHALPCAIELEERGRFTWPRAGAEAGLSLLPATSALGEELLWVGAPGDWAGGEDAGAAALLKLSPTGAPTLIAELHGADGGWLGAAMSLLPDLDGDGLPELAIAAPAAGELLLLPGWRWAGDQPTLSGPLPRMGLVPGQGARLAWRGDALWVGEDDALGETPITAQALAAAMGAEAPTHRGAPPQAHVDDADGAAGGATAGTGAGEGEGEGTARAEGHGRAWWGQSGAHAVGDWDHDGVSDVIFIDRDQHGAVELRAASGRCAARWAAQDEGRSEAPPWAPPAVWRPAQSGLRPTNDVGRRVVVAGPALALGAPRSELGGVVLILGPAGLGPAGAPNAPRAALRASRGSDASITRGAGKGARGDRGGRRRAGRRSRG